MILHHKFSWVFSIALGAFALPASAQMVQRIPGMNANDPVDSLSMHLRTLAANPRNLFALLGAGQAAIDVGDPNAALGFFARADEIDPRSGKAKAGLASALVMLEKPDDAIRLFGEAVSLGVAEADIARDRGLAYDLRGDNRRAQREYMIALRRGPDDEVTRRYALSLGISGDRAPALTMLDPLLRKQDQGAWRARAFIMAMNNDVSGANAVARQVMPANLASTMSPFLTRLAKLNPAERAHAVNFGTMPSDGQSFASVQMGDPFRPAGMASSAVRSPGDALIPAGKPLGRQAASVPLSREERRRAERAAAKIAPVQVAAASRAPDAAKPATMPGFTTQPTANGSTRVSTRIGTRIGPVDPAKLPPEARGETGTIVSMTSGPMPPPDNARIAQSIVTPLPPVPAVEADRGLANPAPGVVGPPVENEPTTTVPFEVASRKPDPGPVVVKPVTVVTPASRLSAIMSGIETETESAPVVLPTLAEVKATQRTAARKVAAAAEAAAAAKLAKDEKAKTLAAAKANPARLWVQVATGSNERGLGTTWKRIREANATLLKPYGGYSVAFKATNRVLAGPVKSSADARALVNALGKAGVSATTFNSEAGQEIAKLGGK